MLKLIIALFVSIFVTGCATLDSGKVTGANSTSNKNEAFQIELTPAYAKITSHQQLVATTQSSATQGPKYDGQASELKNFNVGNITKTGISNIKTTFETQPVFSWVLTLALMGGAGLAWWLGYRLAAVGLAAGLVVVLLAPQVAVFICLGALAVFGFIAYRHFVKGQAATIMFQQVVAGVEKSKAVVPIENQPQVIAAVASTQDKNTQAAVQDLIKPPVSNL